MKSKERIQSLLDAFGHAYKTDYYEGISYGLKIALASIEMEEKDCEQTRQSNHKSNIWNSKPSHETALRSDSKRTQRRTAKMG